MNFTPCTTGTMAQFLYGASLRPDHLSVEVWDENGVPYVANDNGLVTVHEFADADGCEFSRLVSKREAKGEHEAWLGERKHEAEARRARVYARLKPASLIERQRLGLPMTSAEVERMSTIALENAADKFEGKSA